MPVYLRRLLIAFLFVAGIGSSVGSAVSDALELEADLARRPPGCVSGEAEFTQDDAGGQREFSVEVAGFPPGAEVPVKVAGVVVGIMEINTCGTGELEFADDPEPGEAAFPENFPQLEGREIVRVGSLSGKLQADTDDEEEVLLDADLFAALPSCLRGEAELTKDAEGHEFSVEVAGFRPGRRLRVKVADVVVGIIKTDACGAGELEFAPNPEEDEEPFPANFPHLQRLRGSTVQVGLLRGRLQVED
jgi:hypothetical protein